MIPPMDPILPLLLILLWLQNNRQSNERHVLARKRRRPRQFKPRLILENFTDMEIRHQFRLTKNAIMDFYNKIQSQLECPTKRSNAIPGLTKLLAALYYFATGTSQYCVGAKFGFSQPTVARALREVVDCIVSLAPQYLKFPQSPQEILAVKQKFFAKHGFPDVIGIIDCTHVALLPPSATEANYRNRKQFHSVNVQVICGPSQEIFDVVAHFPGSSHDAYILSNSEIGCAFASGTFGDALLLGDNGYRLCSWLMTPYLAPANAEEERYNKAHRRTHSMIKQLFGILKSRFRCLNVTGGTLLYDPLMVSKIIVACCVLQNIANAHNIEIELEDDLTEHISYQGNYGEESNEGRRRRNEITASFFSA